MHNNINNSQSLPTSDLSLLKKAGRMIDKYNILSSIAVFGGGMYTQAKVDAHSNVGFYMLLAGTLGAGMLHLIVKSDCTPSQTSVVEGNEMRAEQPPSNFTDQV